MVNEGVKTAVKVAAGGVLIYVGLHAFGFGGAGVVAKSWAASWHSSIGNVAKDSMFAILQSYGATFGF
jgi:hypothetical protein